jgi:hypothetical protein
VPPKGDRGEDGEGSAVSYPRPCPPKKGGVSVRAGEAAFLLSKLLEEMKILMKLVEEVLREVGVGEVDGEERRAIEERVRKAVKKLREKHISRSLV